MTVNIDSKFLSHPCFADDIVSISCDLVEGAARHFGRTPNSINRIQTLVEYEGKKYSFPATVNVVLDGMSIEKVGEYLYLG